MSLLTTVRRAATLMGFAEPASVVSSPDLRARQLLEMARVDAEELAARVDWQGLTERHSFVAVSATVQPSGLPADFGRFTFDGQVWNGVLNASVSGPTSSSAWASEAGWSNPSMAQRYRLSGGKLEMLGARAGDAISFPYISTKLYRDASGVAKVDLTADDDIFRVSERLIALGLIWRYRQAKGWDYAEDLRSAEREIERASSADGGGIGVVSFAPRRSFDGVQTAYPGVLGP